MTADLAETRTSRTPRQCARCHLTITTGQRYVRYALPPGGELGYSRWLHGAEHVPEDCYAEGEAT